MRRGQGWDTLLVRDELAVSAIKAFQKTAIRQLAEIKQIRSYLQEVRGIGLFGRHFRVLVDDPLPIFGTSRRASC